MKPLPWLIALTGLAACGESGGRSRASNSKECTRDPEVIAEKRACSLDDQCPCGAGCELGQCVAACSSDSDCGDGTCDRFGRCREPGDTSVIAAIKPREGTSLRVVSAGPTFRSSEDERPIQFVVDEGEAGPVRIEASAGLWVRCGDEGEYSPRCTFEGLGAGDTAVVWTRLAEGSSTSQGALRTQPTSGVATRRQALSDATAAGVVSMFRGTTSRTVGAAFAPVDREQGAATNDPLLPGLYEGVARLSASGVGARGDAGTRAGELTLRLTAEVHGSGASSVLVLRDPRAVLHPEGEWIGRVTTGASANVDFPAVVYVASEAWRGAPIEVLADATPAPISVRGEGLAFTLPVRFGGVLVGDRAPFVEWTVSLARTGDLPETAAAPAVPKDAKATLGTERAFDATPWEAAARKAISSESVINASASRRAELLAAFALRGGAPTLAACTLAAAQAKELASSALQASWRGAAGRPPLLTPSLDERLEGAFASASGDVAFTNTLASSAADTEIPCEVTFPTTPTGSATCAAGTSYRLGKIDACAQIADAYGCDVVAAPAGTTFSVGVTATFSGACSEGVPAASLVGNVARTCRMPATSQACAEMTICYAAPSTGADAATSLVATRMTDEQVGFSGDLLCDGGERSLFAADYDFDKNGCPASDPACDRLNAQELIDACERDLARVRDGAPGNLPSYGAGLDQLFASDARCVDAARLITALGFATDGDRRRAQDPSAARTALASRLGMRLAQRLVAYGAFSAREAAQRELLGEMFRNAGQRRTLPTAGEVLKSSVTLWDLLLHPRFATAFDQLDGAIIKTPDYRPFVTGSPAEQQAEYEQAEGLPVALLDLLNAQLALLEPRLEWAALDRDVAALSPMGTALRYALVARPLADSLAARALAEGGTQPAWWTNYQRAASELDAHYKKLDVSASAIAEGRNPLGIEDDDLPLYFFGDEESATTRFSAISDFLIGQMPGAVVSGSTWAPNLVQIARDSWENALPLYIDSLDREIQVRQSQSELEGQLDDIRLDHGNRLAELCYASDLATRDLLEKWTSFDEDTCFYNTSDPECAVDVTGLSSSLLTIDRIGYQFCLVREAGKISSKVAFANADVEKLADNFEDCRKTAEYPVPCAGGSCIRCKPGDTPVPLDIAVFRSVQNADLLTSSTQLTKIEGDCQALYPKADTTAPGSSQLPNPVTLKRGCYNGGMGEAVYGLRQAEQEVRTAQAEFDEIWAQYDGTVRGCIDQLASVEAQTALRTQQDNVMKDKEALRTGLEIAENTLLNGADCVDSIAGVSALNFGVGLAMSAVSCGARLVASGLHAGVVVVEDQLTQLERQYESLLAQSEGQAEFKACMNEASLLLVAQRSTAERVKAAMQEMETVVYQLDEMKISARTIYEDGRAALTATRGRFVAPLAHDFWLGDEVKRFWRDMRFARRVTYLAVRAVEYEQQSSLPLRDDVLRARLPDTLWSVLDELWSMTGTRSVRGNRPTDLKVVLSLKDNLLQLADRSGVDVSEQNLSDEDRLRIVLMAPQHQAFDANGKYVGQRIPFALAPLAQINAGAAQGIPVLAGTDCAERLWSVNASLLGDDLFVGDQPSFARVDILKGNTFASQWCGGAPENGPALQTASVRPTRNLFRDPEYGLGAGVGAGLGLGNETGAESRARIEAYFNVDRADFESDDYANGSTSELAARGLYGDYALFIPKDVISIGGSNGLALDKVDDVLLRFDYVSVAK